MVHRRAFVAGAAALLATHGARADGPPITGAMNGFKVIEDGSPAPQIPVLGFDGNMHTLDEMRGKVLLINFWATWCAPCFAELPEFDRLQARMGGNDFTVMLLNQERIPPEQADAFLDFVGLKQLGTYFDPQGALMRAFNARVLPVTFLIDRDGTIRGRLQGGADWAQKEARDLIQYYLSH